MHAAKSTNMQSVRPTSRRELGRLALCAAGAAALLTTRPALAWNWGLGNSIAGSGTIISSTRAVTGFSGLDLSVPADVTLVQGDLEGVVMETDDNIAPLIETVVEKGVLVIRLRDRNTSIQTKKLRITVNARSLEKLEISGSGNVRSNKLQSQQLTCSIAGSGDVRLAALEAGTLRLSIAGSGNFEAGGKADAVDITIAGSGDVKTSKLFASNVKINIAGSGNAEVAATDRLKVSIAGSGDVVFYGDPVVSKSIAGSGSVKRLGSTPATDRTR